MARRLPSSVSREDVESAALLGLTEAACRYDGSRNEPFMAFATKRVRGAILDHLRRNDLLTRRGRQEARRIADTARTLEAEHGRAVSDSEIAEKMGMSDDEFNIACANLRDASVVHLDELGTMPLSVTSGTPSECIERQQIRAALVRALERLEERELLVLACYYQEGLTLREIGEILGVTESRVCQIHTQTLRTLRSQLS
jgi:RNA polymerase sigma factor for flagellar operon FliA